MALHIIQHVAKGRLVNSVETRNIFHYSNDSAFSYSGGDIQNTRDMVDEIFTALSPVTSSFWTLYEIETNVWDGEEFQPNSTEAKNLEGSEPQDMASFQTAVLFTARTVLKGVLGRKFFPGVCEAFTAAGELDNDGLSAAGAAAAYYLAAVVGDGQRTWVPCTHGGASIASPFVSVSVGGVLSTIRRRKPGYGI